MVRPSKRIRRDFTAALLRPAVALLSWMPRPLALMLGRCLAALGWHCSREQRQRALRHLELALGDTVDTAQRRRIARGVFRHFGGTAAERAYSDYSDSRILPGCIAAAIS